MSHGRLEVITGCMFSGKSEELIRRLRRAKIAKLKVMSFKPLIDNRYDPLAISSHSNQTIDTTPVATSYELEQILLSQIETEMRKISDKSDSGIAALRVVAIDEAQFFTEHIIDIVRWLMRGGVRVIVAGLDTDFRGEPFGAMPALMAIADEVLKLTAVCVKCGEPAIHTHRIGSSTHLIEVGATESYEARCRNCFAV